MCIWRQQRAAVKNYLSNIAWRPMRQKEGNFFFKRFFQCFLFPFNLTRVVLFLVLRNFYVLRLTKQKKKQIGNLRSILYAAFYDAWPYCLWAALSALKLHSRTQESSIVLTICFSFKSFSCCIYMRTGKNELHIIKQRLNYFWRRLARP